MSGRSVGSLIGGIVGAYFGPVGSAIGSAIGGAIGSYISPDVYNGPNIGDAQQQTSQAGVPRPVVYGHPAPFAGNIIDGEAKARKIKIKESNGDGKGSDSYTKVEHFLLTYAIRICEGPIGGVARIWRNGKVVADFRSDADIPPYINGDTAARAKAIAEGRAATVKFMKKCRIYLGTEDQLPDPSLEQIHGVGNVPAYRGTAYIVLTDDDVTDTRGAAAQYQFEVFGVATSDDGSIVSLIDSDVIRRGIFGINTSGGIRTEYDPGENTYWPLTAKPGTPYRAYCHNDKSAPVRAVFRTSPGNNIIFDTGWVCTSASDAAALSAAITGTQYDGAISVVEYGPYPKGTSPIGYGTFTGDETGINWQWMVYNTNDGGVSAYLSIPDQDELPESWTTSPDLPDAYLGSDGKIYYPSWITPPELNVVTNVGLTVGDVVSDIAQRCGVTPNEVDVAVLSETIPGLLVATQCSGAEAIKPIEQLFFFDLPEYDGKLRAIKRGGPITATITDDDIVDADDETTRSQQAEYPAKVYVVTRVPESEYSPIPQVSSRFSNEVVATSEVRIESPIPLSPNAAASAATIIQACLWTQLEGKTELSLPEQFTRIVTSDRIQYDNRSWLVTKLTYADGVVKLSLSYDRANDYKLTAAGVAGQAPALPSPSLSEATTFVPMQLPPLRESDIGKVGIYVTACGTSDAWAGCAVQISLDSGVTVTQIGYITRPADIGETTTSVSPSDSMFSVDLIYGELNSLPEVSLESGGNSAALVEANGIGEIVQHLDATEVADNEYNLYGVNRGVLFTEDESHASGTRYTTLANAMFVPISSALVGKDVMVRCPTIGTDPNTSAWKTLTLKDMSKKSIKYPNPINLYEVVEAPYLNAVASLSPTDLALLPSSVGFVVSMAAPRGAEIDYSMIVDPGTGTYSDVGRSGWAATAVPFYLLMLPFSQTDTILPNLALSGNRLDKVTSGMIGFWDGEVVITTTDGSSGSVGIKRGCADTVPAVHESNTRIWFYDVGHIFGKDKYSDGQTINVKLLSNTDTAQLIPEFAEPIPITFNQRFNRPYPPGKLRITDSVATDAAYPTDCVGALTITWAHRNRITQGTTPVDESAASVTPESGTTYNVRYYLDGVLEHSESGIVGTSAMPYTLSGNGNARIEVWAVRDGLESWQGAWAEFNYLATPGGGGSVIFDPPTGSSFATLSSFDTDGNVTLSLGGLKATRKSGSAWSAVNSTVGKKKGKWYFEVTNNANGSSTGDAMWGFNRDADALTTYPGNASLGSTSMGWQANNTPNSSKFQNGSLGAVSGYGTVAVSGWSGFAIDLDAGKLWVKNGSGSGWAGGGDPEAGTSPTFTFTANTHLRPTIAAYSGPQAATVNFGASAFNGTVPAGFEAGIYSAPMPCTSFAYSSRFSVPSTNDIQGVATDGSNIWVSDSTNLYKYDMAGALVTSRAVSGDSPTKTQINGLHIVGGVLYVSAAYNSTPRLSYIVEYDPNTLAYIAHHAVSGDWFSEGLAWKGGYWWVCFHANSVVAKVDPATWSVVATYPLTYKVSGSSGGYGSGTGYDGIAWLGDYLLCNIHEIYDQKLMDIYIFDGSDFIQVGRTPHPTTWATQGITVNPLNEYEMFFAERTTRGDSIARIVVTP